MNWILIALIPPFLWAVSNIVAKVIRTKHIKNSLSYTIISSFISSLLLTGILFRPISIKLELIYLVPILSGILVVLQYMLYIKALSLEDTSTLIPFFNFDPLMVLVLSTIFLNEILVSKHYVAFALLAAGGILVSMKRSKIHFSKGIMLILASAFIWSTYSVIIKFVLNFIDSWTSYMLVRVGILAVALFLMLAKGIRHEATKTWLSLNKKTRNILIVTELSSASGMFFVVYAASMAPISLVTVIGGLQSVFVLLMAAVLSFKFQKIFKEEIDRRIIIQKSIAIALMITGLVFLA